MIERYVLKCINGTSNLVVDLENLSLLYTFELDGTEIEVSKYGDSEKLYYTVCVIHDFKVKK